MECLEHFILESWLDLYVIISVQLFPVTQNWKWPPVYSIWCLVKKNISEQDKIDWLGKLCNFHYFWKWNLEFTDHIDIWSLMDLIHPSHLWRYFWFQIMCLVDWEVQEGYGFYQNILYLWHRCHTTRAYHHLYLPCERGYTWIP